MATLSITFTGVLNPSLQVGDTVYYCTPGSGGHTSSVIDAGTAATTTFAVEDNLNEVIKFGTVLAINSVVEGNNWVIVVDTGSLNVNAPTSVASSSTTLASYIFFGKDNAVNVSSLTGYFASVKFVNNSTTAAELFSISAQATESSK